MKEGFSLPLVKTEIPGKNSIALAKRLGHVESRNLTFIAEDFPIFLDRAYLNNVWDIDDNRYVDMTSFFGVASIGHRNEIIYDTISKTSIIHGMGDVLPSESKVRLLEILSEKMGGGYKGILAQSGSEAVESCIKTAYMHTKKPGIIAFKNSYHGLGLGAFNLTYNKKFREPFSPYLGIPVNFIEFPTEYSGEKVLQKIENMLKNMQIGMVFLEPVQARGGVNIFPRDFIKKLKVITEKYGVLLGFDEIYAGFYRCGFFSLSEYFGVKPDIIALGKGLSSQFPLSVCLAKSDVMDSWPTSDGEAIHTYTFTGHPLFCSATISVINYIDKNNIPERVQTIGKYLYKKLSQLKNKKSIKEIRGMGLLYGIELDTPAFPIVKKLLQKGFITLPSGNGNVLELSPTFQITKLLIDEFIRVLDETI